ncbi:MAG: hypothetical protein VXY73_10880 [Pseudomonadota bacterium]|jgi:hypothetical protein|nr:hypothetical protein [Pseudomonadota bacterium]
MKISKIFVRYSMLKRTIFLLIALTASTHSALAYCSEPSFYSSEPEFYGSTPSAPHSYQKPDVPYCLSSYSYSGTHTCEEYELEAYFEEVEEYINYLNNYYKEALDFAEEANDFAEQAISFANDVARHTNDVLQYANCEAQEVKQQHE